MKVCPWLQRGQIAVCGAVRSPVALSLAELRQCCTSGAHQGCPIWRRRVVLGHRLTLEEYTDEDRPFQWRAEGGL